MTLSLNTEAVGSGAHEKQQKLIEKMESITDEVRDAVLEKWLSYSKCSNLNDFIVWRLHFMSRIYSTRETVAIKVILT